MDYLSCSLLIGRNTITDPLSSAVRRQSANVSFYWTIQHPPIGNEVRGGGTVGSLSDDNEADRVCSRCRLDD
jgi:hypothetical protein